MDDSLCPARGPRTGETGATLGGGAAVRSTAVTCVVVSCSQRREWARAGWASA